MTLTASIASVPIDIAGTTAINAETFNGAIPGPTIQLTVGDTLIVRLINDLPYPTGIHWHGVELENYSDGTEVTQSEVPGAPLQVLGNGVPAGGTFLYKFKVPKPGIFWYHPHHHHSTNRVFRGLYGMIVVRDTPENTLMSTGVLPSLANTYQLVLSDITVCKAPTMNDPATYVNPTTIMPASDRPEWLSGATAQNGPTPADLCELAPLGDDGMPGAAFGAGQIPNTFQMTLMLGTVSTVEGQTVLTNGVNVGGRKGTPTAPTGLDPGFSNIPVAPGQGIRFQIANTATTRYFRLILTTAVGTQINLIRVGGEGGVLNDAILEGGMMGTYNTKYSSGEILIPPASRADIVAVIPLGTTGVCTMWTRDFQRTGPANPGNWAQLPTVPVLHLDVNLPAVPLFPMGAGTALKSSIGASTPALGPPTDPNPFLDPGTFSPVKPGAPSAAIPTQEIRLTAGGGANGINGVLGSFDFMAFPANPHIGSTRYARAGNTLQFRVVNQTNAHHPFHLHGFSFHPVSIEPNGGAVAFTWPITATEYRDNFDIPAGHTITFKVHISPRELADGVTAGGAFGRWLFHCHIFFHAHHGMISELVITDPDGTGSEKPTVSVGGSWAYAAIGSIAQRAGTYSHPDGDAVTLSAHLATGASIGTLTSTGTSSGTWSWSFDTTGMPAQIQYVYISATDASGRKDQAVFRLKIGTPDDGSDVGDPHITTVDGHYYDFQAAGEFTLLRDGEEDFEFQVRQTPVPSATPIVDGNTGLRSCVSVNTAIAARVGRHRIAYQPISGRLQFFVDGEPRQLSDQRFDLGNAEITSYLTSDGARAIQLNCQNGTILNVTPWFWSSYNIWLLNLSISHTAAESGIMGRIPSDTWLPALPSGATLGPKPEDLHDRYITLYRTFADAWRVTDLTSLFLYTRGTSTATFTDRDWPSEQPPCRLKPEFELPGAKPPLVNINVATAERKAKVITFPDLFRSCVFDVATTGDETLVKSYLEVQNLRLSGSTVQIVRDNERTKVGEPVLFTATVLTLTAGRPTPTGTITFVIDNVEVGSPVRLNNHGRAFFKTNSLAKGPHEIRAFYTPGSLSGCLGLICRLLTKLGLAFYRCGVSSYRAASSRNLPHIVE